MARESVETLLYMVSTFLRDSGEYGVMVRQSAEMVVYHVDLGDGELQFHHVEVSYRWSGLG